MNRRSLIAAAMLALLGAVPAVAAGKVAAPPPPGPEATPEAIVRNLYDRYAADAFDYMTNGKLAARYFTAATATLLTRTFAKSKKLGEPGIDYEPLIDGQDGETKELVIATTASGADAATVEARFVSFGEKLVVTFDFKKDKGAWRIDEIRGRDGTSLRGTMTDFLR